LIVIRNLTLFIFFVLIVFIVVSLSNKLFKFFLPFGVGGIIVEHTSLNDLIIEAFFVLGFRQDALLDFRGCDQSEHAHFVLLPDSMGSVFGLLIHLRVPIGVENDDGV